MMKALLKRMIARFERQYGYDATYMRELVDEDTAGGFKLMLATLFLSHDFGAPKALYYAAKVRSTMRADCGPCLRLAIAMAEEAGISRERLLPVVGYGRPDPDMALAIKLADAVAENAPELTEISAEAKARFGARAAAGLAAATLAGQFYPLLKRGMGHAATCEPVVQALVAAAAAEERRKEEMEAG
ncbi:hypothetical protein FQ775_18045 [Nitratireductor mangrovi]|uniref:Carboxymuconolactone decarboxylase family protein n=1 Tax=Nitratireductor mangrovi TaxID=2599600 RepID=A0A5B8L2T1_9HYPH|nr:hypothetical protein [Nitratireductor mangrovi]QDZ02129.1 hypothetical protein FQ775_18045 [Nitratireductor mangrovi]